ncbi:MAG: HEAT repeat domain-containing protein [Planctomycetota bacterium]|nr:HEAT repeat domain-containing protein [Planctomycetota bacterium]
MSDTFSNLRHALCDFDEWASTFADRRNSDWPTDYPATGELVYAASSAMRLASDGSVASDEELLLIARVWTLTEEPESMVEEAIAIGAAVGPVLRRLFAVGDWEARWQIVSVVPRLGVPDVDLIEWGTRDAHAYVRRRAWLALHEVSGPLAIERAIHALESEPDGDLRRVLTQIVAGGAL